MPVHLCYFDNHKYTNVLGISAGKQCFDQDLEKRERGVRHFRFNMLNQLFSLLTFARSPGEGKSVGKKGSPNAVFDLYSMIVQIIPYQLIHNLAVNLSIWLYYTHLFP